MNNQLENISLVIFDFDGTLVEFPGSTILPGVVEWFAANKDVPTAIVSNAGGVGLRHWMETENFGDPDLYPTAFASHARIAAFMHEVDCEIKYYLCFAYQSQKNKNWGPVPYGMQTSAEWDKAYRKPAPGMLLQAIYDHHVDAANVLMVGDWSEDRYAAEAVPCKFMHADDFFGRRK